MGWNFNQGQGKNTLIPHNSELLGAMIAGKQSPKK